MKPVIDSHEEFIKNSIRNFSPEELFQITDRLIGNCIGCLDVQANQYLAVYLHEWEDKLRHAKSKITSNGLDSSQCNAIYSKRRERLERHQAEITLSFEKSMSHRVTVNSLISFLFGGKCYLASGGGDEDRTIKIWDCKDFSLVKTLKKHRGGVSKLLNINEKGKNLLISASYDNTVKVWDLLRNFSLIKSYSSEKSVNSLLYIPTSDESILLSAQSYSTKNINFYNLRNFSTFSLVNKNEIKYFIAVNKFPLGAPQILTSDDKGLKVWDLKTKAVIKKIKFYADTVLLSIPENYSINEISKGVQVNQPLIVAAGYHCLKIFNSDTWDMLREIQVLDCRYKMKFIPQILCRKGKLAHPMLICLDFRSNCHVWDPYTGEEIFKFTELSLELFDICVRGFNQSNLLFYTPQLLISIFFKLLKIDFASENITELDLDTEQVGKSQLVTIKTKCQNIHSEICLSYDSSLRIRSFSDLGYIVSNPDVKGKREVSCIKKIEYLGQPLMCVGNSDGVVQLWDPFSEGVQFISQWKAHKGKVSVIKEYEESRDGRYIITGGADKFVKIWEIEKVICLRTLHFGGDVKRIDKLTDDGIFSVSGGENQIFKIFDFSTGECVKSVYEGHGSEIKRLVYVPPDLIASTSRDGVIKLWDCRDGTLRDTIGGIPSNTSSLVYIPVNPNLPERSPNVPLFAIGGLDDKIMLIEIQTGRLIRNLEIKNIQVHCMDVILPNNSPSILSKSTLLAAGCEWVLNIWNAHIGSLLYSINAHEFSIVSMKSLDTFYFSNNDLSVSPMIVTGGCGEPIKIWDAYQGSLVTQFEAGDDFINSIVVLPYLEGGSVLIATAGGENKIRVREYVSCTDNKEIRTIKITECVYNMISIPPIQSQTTFHSLVLGCSNNVIRIYNPYNGELISNLEGHSRYLLALSYIPHGYMGEYSTKPLLVTGGPDCHLIYWDLEKLELFLQIPPGFGVIKLEKIPNSTNNLLMVMGVKQECRILTSDSFSQIHQFKDVSQVVNVKVRSELFLVGVTDYERKIISFAFEDFQSINFVFQENMNRISTMKKIPKDHCSDYLGVGFENGDIILFDLEADKILFKSANMHTYPIASFSHHNFGLRRVIMSADKDGSIVLFNLDGKCVMQIPGCESEIEKLKIIHRGGDSYILGLFSNFCKLWLISFSRTYKTLKNAEGYHNYLLGELYY